MEVETWRPIRGYEGAYAVSDLGRVRSLPRTITRFTQRGPVLARMKGRLLKPINGGAGYAMVNLGAADRRYLHELVLTTFVSERPVGLQAAHYDGDRRNNRAGNLRWATRAENEADKANHGTRLTGARTPNGRKTRCPRGHAYDYVHRGKRQCRTCRSDRQRQARQAAQIARLARSTLAGVRRSGNAPMR
jgi:NUMOD4 motif/HNH endonuclease